MARQKKQFTEAAVRKIRRRTRRKFSPEEKIRIVLEGLRGEQSLSEDHYADYMAMDAYQNLWVVPAGRLPSGSFTTLDAWAGTKRAHLGTKSGKVQ